MKKMTIILAALLAAACTNYLYQGEVDLTIVEVEEEFEYPTSYSFNHPCALVAQSDIDRIKDAVAAADENDPVYVSWTYLCGSTYAQKSYTPSPVEILIRGDYTGIGTSENYMAADRDAAAAMQLAIRWLVSEDDDYAEAAINILNQWAKTCTKITANDANYNLLAGFQGSQFANAGELLRDYEGWAATDQATYKQWLTDVWYSINYEFITLHGNSSTCNLHYWSNWELGNLASLMAYGIYTENIEVINFVYKNFREGDGSGCLTNFIPYEPVDDPYGLTKSQIAQNMESGRDQGHSTLCVSICAELCQMAWNVGLDFWGMEDNLFLCTSEYAAAYNATPYLVSSMPFTEYLYCTNCSCTSSGHSADHLTVSSDDRGTERPGWDLIYNHYKHEKGLGDDYLYYTKRFAEQLRYYNGTLTGDGGAGISTNRYGSNSGAFDAFGWGTLLFYRD